MKEGPVNLFSDTQTRPTRAMLEAMFEAEVGDEQLDLDPTTNRLCEAVAELLGKPAALYLPSGTMCNQVAMLVHGRPSEEVYAHPDSHVICFEGGGASAFAGMSFRTVDGPRGTFTAEAFRTALRDDHRYAPRPRVLAIEQTTNVGGGAIWNADQIDEVAEVARSRDMRVHMDGARLLHAVVASGISAERFCRSCDSAWIDLSKGLGCPIGAVLAGSEEFIEEAWLWKTRMGGGLRQSGILAAAGLYALEHHVERLAEDHANAKRFAEIVGAHPGVAVDPEGVETNIVFLDLTGAGARAEEVRSRLEEEGINVSVFGEFLLRAVTHLDVDRSQVEEAGRVMVRVLGELGEAS